jgi:hypothetical protein
LQSSISKSTSDLIFVEIERILAINPDFQEAHDTYLQQYGQSKISLSEPVNLTNSIDPVVLILGRNCVITYNDSTKHLKGSQAALRLQPNEIYVVGRREPQDSKLVVWSSKGAIELEEYNSRVDTIPSRVHGVFANLIDGKNLYADLGSSAGSIIVGQSPELGGAFVRIYDPGSEESPTIRFDRIFTSGR